MHVDYRMESNTKHFERSSQQRNMQQLQLCLIVLGMFVCGQISIPMLIKNRHDTVIFSEQHKAFAPPPDIASYDIPSVSSCDYDIDDDKECLDIISLHINASLTFTRSAFIYYLDEKQKYSSIRDTYVNRRWLLLGDSTIARLFYFSSVKDVLKNQSVSMYQYYRSTQCLSQHNAMECHEVYLDRCDTMEQLNFTPASTDWKKPNFTNGEGPHAYGYENAYCSDCFGCNTELITCTKQSLPNYNSIGFEKYKNGDHCHIDSHQVPNYIGPSYGGYMSIEFARDVELQSIDYPTTQENMLLNYIAKKWNSPIDMVVEFGFPICIVSTGLHDVSIPGITEEAYKQNVKWYVELLSNQCEYIVWVSNTCPLTDKYAQKQKIVYDWNMDIMELLSSDEYSFKSFFLDVYNASKSYEHEDNIHMSGEWYSKLGSFFIKLMTMKLG
jgi:hypothetical protein